MKIEELTEKIRSLVEERRKSVWNFFGDFFRCVVLGLDTYKEYLPALTR